MFLKVRDESQTGNLAIDGAKNCGRGQSWPPLLSEHGGRHAQIEDEGYSGQPHKVLTTQ